MANANDKLILELMKKVETKKAKIAEMELTKYRPVTHCILEWEGTKYNFNVMKYNDLKLLLLKLNAILISADDLEVYEELEDIEIQGHTIHNWINDICGKLKERDFSQEKAKLKQMEGHLDNLLSAEKKVEIKLAEIAKLLD
ncbi:hypothetical protein vBBceHLY2_00093 [Bacillus phage vB_BceH_LY2]|nr:hypothetical protein vBBceHLY2_00093 [Bacillus phage vB_BceH_LY2]